MKVLGFVLMWSMVVFSAPSFATIEPDLVLADGMCINSSSQTLVSLDNCKVASCFGNFYYFDKTQSKDKEIKCAGDNCAGRTLKVGHTQSQVTCR